MKAIVNTDLILENSILRDGVLLMENETIAAVGPRSELSIPDGSEIVDAGGAVTAPGFVDIHNHGSGDTIFPEDPVSNCEWFVLHGETTVLPTFYMTLSREEMLEGADRLREYAKTGLGRIIDGLYMEGPYMSGGSFESMMKWDGPIRREDYLPLVEHLKGYARVWAVDPGREGIAGFMQDVKRIDPRAIFSYGHSTASYSAAEAIRK